MLDASFRAAATIADAVLYEGYILYPYRKSALKNQLRWQFGIIAPRPAAEHAGTEPWDAESQFLLEPGEHPVLTIQLRFLQLQMRTIETPLDAALERWSPCDGLTVDGRELLSWEEAVPREITERDLPLDALGGGRSFALRVAGGREVEPVCDATGDTVARIVRERWPLSFALHVAAHPSDGLLRIDVRVENTAAAAPPGMHERQVALRSALVGCHALVGVEDGSFLSLIDPPPHAVAAAKACTNRHWWPVLAGPHGSHDVVLCAPIILYDYPAIAPESAGDFFDATEIDELLTLRMLTLTDAEKREITATDERARHLLERAERAAPHALGSLHGAIRQFGDARGPGHNGALPAHPGTTAAHDALSWESLLNPPHVPSPEQATIVVGGAQLRQGSRVRLAPRGRADAMDMFLDGRVATIAAIYQDLDDRTHVAVTLDDDPAAELHREFGRFFYFSPGELVPLAPEGDAHAAE